MSNKPFIPTGSLPKSQFPFLSWLRCRSQKALGSAPAKCFGLWETGLVSPDRSEPTVQSPRSVPQRWRQFLFSGIALALLTAIPVQAAERIVFAYGQLEYYLPVSSLETFAKDGTVDRDLGFYFRFFKVTPDAQAKIRKGLQATSQEKPLPVSQVLYAPMGVAALRNLGELIQTGPNRNGFYALRAASILSAADPEGLSFIGFLRHFPTPNIRINLPQARNLIEYGSKLVDVTNAVVQAINTRSQAEAKAEGPINLATLPPLQIPGPYQFTKRTLMLQDSRRDRPIATDLYVPDFKGNMPASIPVVVFSHGLGETREFTAPFMETMATNGFVVASPEHIGSDKGQQERLLAGRAQEIFRASEFYDRPQDVSFVLDTLEQNNQTEFGGRLNLKQVGVYGHSFGGYTVLVLGGATVDFKRLRQECEKDFLLQSLNNSLLLQCRALELESSPQAELLTSGKLQDPRVKFVMPISPVTSAILGPSGLSRVQVPVVLIGGSYDPIAPLVPEQTDAFVWLTTPDKYLIISTSLSHTPQITEMMNRLILPAKTTDELDEKLGDFLKYFRGVGLAFMQVYVANRSDFRPYLQASYVQTLQVPPFNFSLIRSFPADELNQLMRR